jgi:hypothetical protein
MFCRRFIGFMGVFGLWGEQSDDLFVFLEFLFGVGFVFVFDEIGEQLIKFTDRIVNLVIFVIAAQNALQYLLNLL